MSTSTADHFTYKCQRNFKNIITPDGIIRHHPELPVFCVAIISYSAILLMGGLDGFGTKLVICKIFPFSSIANTGVKFLNEVHPSIFSLIKNLCYIYNICD